METLEKLKEIEQAKAILKKHGYYVLDMYSNITNIDYIERLADKHIEDNWGGYKDDALNHPDLITEKTFGQISRYDYIAGYKKAIDNFKHTLI